MSDLQIYILTGTLAVEALLVAVWFVAPSIFMTEDGRDEW